METHIQEADQVIVQTGIFILKSTPLMIIRVLNVIGDKVGIGTDTPAHPLHMGSGAHVTSGGVWTNASDRSKKYAITDLPYGLADLMELRPTAYHYKADSTASIGFIAQEIETVIPEVVSGEDGEKGVAYGLLTSVLVKAIQEQQEVIDALKADNENMNSKIIQLESIESEVAELKTMIQQLQTDELRVQNK